MLKIIKPYFTHSDSRGTFEGLVNFGQWQEANLVRSAAGVERGNHFHKETVELFIVLEGEIRVVLQKVENQKLVGQPVEKFFKGGDVFLVEPMVNHIFQVLTDAKWLNMLAHKMDSENPDMHTTDIMQ